MKNKSVFPVIKMFSFVLSMSSANFDYDKDGMFCNICFDLKNINCSELRKTVLDQIIFWTNQKLSFEQLKKPENYLKESKQT